MTEKGEGAAIRFIRDHQSYPHADWCLIWPFSTPTKPRIPAVIPLA
jgi:hypothetical protein